MTDTASVKNFTAGAIVVDRDGFSGQIVKVTEWKGSVWYDIRFPGGVAVRYSSDLTVT